MSANITVRALVQPHHTLVPFDETYILYNPRDPISVVSAYLSLSPILILMFYLSWFLVTRELESLIIAGGQLANEVANKILKRVFRQSRPLILDGFELGPGYGMPSAHSQFVGFLTTYVGLRLWLRWENPRVTMRYKVLYTGIVAGFSLAVCCSRVYLGYHSWEQVIVGASLGLFNGAAFFGVVGLLRELGILEWILTWPVLEWFYVKDSCNRCPVTLYQEHLNYRARLERAKRTV